MKKFFVVISILIAGFAYYHFFIWGHFGNGYYIAQPNRTILKNKGDKNFFLSDIINIKQTDRYLIALRIPEKFYACLHSSPIVCKPVVAFVIVDKTKKKVYETEDDTKFSKKLEALSVNKKFSKEEIEKARAKASEYVGKCTEKNIPKTCKEDYSLNIVQY